MANLMDFNEFVSKQNVPVGAAWTQKEQVEAYQAYLQIETQKERATGNLASALRDMVRASLKASAEEIDFGHPLSGLIDWAMSNGIEAIAENLVEKLGEFRLNGAGLKIYTSFSAGKLRVVVSGDQFGKYSKTGPILNSILKDRGLQ